MARLSVVIVANNSDLLPALKSGGSPRARRFGITSPLLEGLIPGQVSDPLPLSLLGLGVMSRLFIIVNGSKSLILITEGN